jgi:Fe2+ or Zn2+ uptake regulation protein
MSSAPENPPVDVDVDLEALAEQQCDHAAALRRARQAAVLDVLHQRLPLVGLAPPMTSYEVHAELEAFVSYATVRRALRELHELGAIERVRSAPGSHYPFCGWRMRARFAIHHIPFETDMARRRRPARHPAVQLALWGGEADAAWVRDADRWWCQRCGSVRQVEEPKPCSCAPKRKEGRCRRKT